MNNEVTSVYVHIPFCKKICSYCDFCKLIYNDDFALTYLMALEKEITSKYEKDKINTLYIGGGTPSALTMGNLKKLFNIIKLFNLSEEVEFTFELNLDDIREELLEILKENNVTRLSIGIQSFNSHKLHILEREADFKDAKYKIDLCKKHGFNNINVDLMYAVPGESVSDTKNDIKKFLKLGTTHISTYSLIIEDHTKLKIDKTEYINEKEDAKMYKVISKKLKKKGYNHYEVSNFALKNYEAKHNLVYWNNEEYYGFGLGAAGYIGGVRYENTRSLNEYVAYEFVKEQNVLSKKERMDNEIMLGFRKLEGININHFNEKFEADLFTEYDFTELIKKKLVIRLGDNIFINPKKIYIMNEILLKLI